MSPRRNRQRQDRRKTARANSVQASNERGIFAVRRRISTDNIGFFNQVSEKLEPELLNAGRLIKTSNLSVTVVGFTRFDRNHRFNGIPTEQVVAEVPSTKERLFATVGALGIFGSGSKHKLSFSLYCPELIDEVGDFEEAFEQNGFPLAEDPNNDSDEPSPHVSVVWVYEDHLGHINDRKTLKRLTTLCLADQVERPVIALEPVNPANP